MVGPAFKAGRSLPYWLRVSRRLQWLVLTLALLAGIGIGAAIAVVHSSDAPGAAPASLPQTIGSPQVDPGAKLSGAAPGFALTDQFGKRVSLRSLRGKVVVVSFNDPVCTTICPLTTTALLHAKKLLGPAGRSVQLIGIGANPDATGVDAVRAYSRAHRMMHKWRFLTGSLPELKRVWRDYGIEAAVVQGEIDHTPATFVIDSRGRYSRLYLTEMAYSSVDELGYQMAQSMAALLPGHPQLRGAPPSGPISLLGPRKAVTLPRSGGGVVRLGPGSGPHLVLFFDTWETETSDLSRQLEALNRYQRLAPREHLPPLVAVDEAGVEASPQALPSFLRSLPRPLAYPVAVDADGRVADGYRVQDSPWLELVSGSGRFLFYKDLADGWPSTQALVRQVHEGLARSKG
jgi:cytochrome oxidase Cu insertion factor (SCO1/SenC/PrrC family)